MPRAGGWDVARIADEPRDGLPEGQPGRRMHQNQLQQRIGTANAASPAQRTTGSRLFTPIFWEQIGEKFPFLIEQVNGLHALCLSGAHTIGKP